MNIKKYLKETVKYALRSPLFYRRYLKEIEQMDRMSADELRQRNDKIFIDIFRRAYDKSPFYHRLYTEAGISKEDIRSIDDLQRLPIIEREDVRDNCYEMLTISPLKARLGAVVSQKTTGTSGMPLHVFGSWPQIWREQAYIHFTRSRAGFTPGQRLVSLRGNLDGRDTHLKVHANNTLYLSTYNINKEHVQLYHRLINEFRPQAIEGFPSSLYNLALCLRDAGLKVNIPVAFTSSENFNERERAVICEYLGCDVFDLYGQTERVGFFMERLDHDGFYAAPGYSIVELDPEGMIGTSLINSAFPLIRYRTTDIIDATDADHITGIVGRREDFIYLKDGSMTMRLDYLFKGIDSVIYSQLIQDRIGELDINIVADARFGDEQKQLIMKRLYDRVPKDLIDVRINLVDQSDIIIGSRRKFKFIINRVKKS